MATGGPWARALGPKGPWAHGPGLGPLGPPVAMSFHKTADFSTHMYIAEILWDELLSKNINLGEFLSRKVICWRFFYDFPDFWQNQKDARRNSEQFPGSSASRSLF